ncbi:MAG: hypothetical protein RLZZ156_85, partial [Deinococcota bacterium]
PRVAARMPFGTAQPQGHEQQTI